MNSNEPYAVLISWFVNSSGTRRPATVNMRWYRPRRASSSSWLPSSTIRPPSSTRMRVGQPRRGEAVGNDDGGAPGCDLHEPLVVHRLLLQRVDRRRGFVQQDRVMLAKQPACDRQPLPLSEGEVAGAELPRQHHVQPSGPCHSSSGTPPSRNALSNRSSAPAAPGSARITLSRRLIW